MYQTLVNVEETVPEYVCERIPAVSFVGRVDPIPFLRQTVRGAAIPCGYSASGPVGGLTIDRIMGLDAQKKYRLEYAYLGDNLYVNNREPHPHPMGATDRAIAHKILHYGMYPVGNVLDVGASYWRNIITPDRTVHGELVSVPLANRVWSTTPLLDVRDRVRELDVLEKISLLDAQTQLGVKNVTQLRSGNNCRCVGGYGTGVSGGEACPCQVRIFSGVTAIDSAYYPGVLEEILKQCHRNSCSAGIAFFDYDRLFMSGIKSLNCGESELSFIDGLVHHKVKGNLAAYEHKRVNTQGHSSYQYFCSVLKSWFLFERVWETDNCGLKYSIFKIRHSKDEMVGVPVVTSLLTRVNPVDESVRVGHHLKLLEDNLEEFCHGIVQCLKFGESFGFDPVTKRYEAKLVVGKNSFGFRQYERFVGDAKIVHEIVSRFQHRTKLGELGRVSKATEDMLIKDPGLSPPSIDTGYKMNPQTANSVCVVATILALRLSSRYLLAVNNSSDLLKLKTAANAVQIKFEFADWIKRVWIALQVVLGVYLLNLGLNWVQSRGVAAYDGQEIVENPLQSITYVAFYSGLFIVSMFWTKIKSAISVGMPHSVQRWWHTDCLHDKRTADLSEFVDRFDVRGDIVPQFPDNWVCNTRSRIGPVKVGPRIRGLITDRVVTQNHACNLSDASAVKRMIDVKLVHEDNIWAEFEDYIMTVVFDEYWHALDSEPLYLDYEEWVSSYPQAYQEMLRREENDPDMFYFQNKAYKMHSKTDELNIVTFDQDDQMSSQNNIKKRAISGPPDWEKVVTNCMFKALSSWQKVWDDSYMVGLDFSQISARFEDHDLIPNKISVEDDGSKFDGSQKECQNRLANLFFSRLLTHPNVSYSHLVPFKYVEHVLDKALIFRIKAMRGALTFKVDGRGSGQGWTTHVNTNLNKWYKRFTAYKAQIPLSQWKTGVAGDDGLTSMNKNYALAYEYWLGRLYSMEDRQGAHGLGQICKKLIWGNIEDLSFISCHFYRTRDDGLRMVRVAGRALQTLAFSAKVPHPQDELNLSEQAIDEWFERPHIADYMKGLLAAKAMCGLAWGKNIGFWETIYLKMLNLGNPHHHASLLREYGDESKIWTCTDPDEGAYEEWFIKRYATTRTEIDEFLLEVQNLNSLDSEIRSSLVDRIMLVDCPYNDTDRQHRLLLLVS